MTSRPTPVHVIGGGLAGLVAAITVAETGVPVTLHEAAGRLGGAALSDPGPYKVNVGPHVLPTDGPLPRWMATRGLPLRLRRARLWGNALIDDTGLHRLPRADLLTGALSAARQRAPEDESFASWADRRFGTRNGADLARLAGLGLFCDDPGALSAGFVWERMSRTLRHPMGVGYVVGGWSTVVDVLVARATAVGVQVEHGSALGAGDLPTDGPVIVATGLAAASPLLGRELTWPGARTALLDVAFAANARRSRFGPQTVADLRSDLTTCCMADLITTLDPTSGPAGTEVVQAQLGIDAGTDLATAVTRIEKTLDAAHSGWREGERWRRTLVAESSSGALDPPGTTWRDRPAIDQGDGHFLAGHMTAAPGHLSEISVNSAVRAAHLVLEHRRQAAFAPGWPTVTLTPEHRIAALTAGLGTSATTRLTTPTAPDRTWTVAPAEENEPYVRVRTGRWVSVAVGATETPGGTDVHAVVGTRATLPRPATWALQAIARWVVRRSTERLG